MAVAANPQETFLWGKGGQKKTPEQVQRDRELAALLMQGGADYSPVQHWAQGLARMSQGIVGGLESRWADEAEAAGMEGGKAAFDPILQALTGGAGSSGPSFAGAPGMGGASASGGNSYRDAIASIESAGSGDYNAVGPTHDTLGRALGRYQVMEANIGPWSREALGREITPDEFMASPELQDAIFDHRFGSYVDQYGPQGAAQAWFAGPGGVGKLDRRDALGTSVSAYTDKFTNAIGGAQPTPVQVASLDPSIGMPAQLPEIGPSGGPQLSPAAAAPQAPAQEIAQALMASPQGAAPASQANNLLPLLLQASGDPWARKQYGGIIDALMGQQMQQMDPAYQQQLRAGDLGIQRSEFELNQLLNPGPAKPEYAFTQLDDGTFVRTDKTSGTFENMGQFSKPDPGFRLMTPDELQGVPGLDPNKAYQVGPDNKIYEIGGGGVNVNLGDQGQRMGTVPAGMAAVPDPSNPSGFRLEPIPGGPAAMAAEAAAAAAAAGQEASGRTANIVREDIGRIKSIVESAPWYNPAVGFGADLAASIAGSNATNVSALSKTVLANIGFDRLQQMREASPTGGALGAISDRELGTLQAVMGNLEQSQSVEQFIYNLDRLGQVYDEISQKAAAYPNAKGFGFVGEPGQSQANPDVVDFTDYFK